MAAPALGAAAAAIAKRVAISLGIRAASDPERMTGCALKVGGVIAGMLVVGALFLGALASAVPTVVFGGATHPDMASVINDYLNMAARIGNKVAGTAQSKADAEATTGELTEVRAGAPDWRYLLAIAAVQCDQEFKQADLGAVEQAVLAHVTYSTTRVATTPTETVVASAMYGQVGTVARDFPLPARAMFSGRENEAAEIYLSSLSSINEQGRYDPYAAVETGGGVGMTPEVAAKLKASGVVIEPGSPVETALSYLGVPYHWGGKGRCPMDNAHGTKNHPGPMVNCLDCSGLISYVFPQHGVQCPHGSKNQARWGGRAVTAAELLPGDVVFFGNPTVYHVGIYIGGGYFVHAPGTHKYVSIAVLANRKDFVSARRWDWQYRTAPVKNPRIDPSGALPQ